MVAIPWDEQVAQELQQMADSDGWGRVVAYIEDQVTARLKMLERDVFTDVAQVARLQGEMAGLRLIQNFVQDRVKRSRGFMALQRGDF